MTDDPLRDHIDDLRAATEPDEARLGRIRAGASRPPRASLVAPLLGGGAALAATALVVAWLGRPMPDVPVSESWDGTIRAEVGEAIRVSGEGRAELVGTARDARIALARGTVALEVEPDAAVEVEVRTEEGVVRVVGTVFQVTRDALGTTVAVERGRVEVVCAGDAPERLVGGGRHTCLPVDGAGWLRRTTALLESGAFSLVVEGVERALVDIPEPAIALELELQRAVALARLGRAGDATRALDGLEDRAPERVAPLRALVE